MPIYKTLLTIAICTFLLNIANAQNEDATNTFTPYSFYGVGDLVSPGFAYHRAMGGIGIGIRTNSTINYLNPAALSAQDTLSFMFDFGGEMQNYYLATSTNKTASNSFNMHHVSLSFPVWRKLTLGLSLLPYSSVGYKVTQKETDPEILVEAGDITYINQGEGGLNQLMLSLGYSFGRLSIGGQVQYVFGTIDRYSNVIFNTETGLSNVNGGQLIKASNFLFGVGAQYEQPFEKYYLTLGAVYQFQHNMKVEQTDFAYSIGGVGTYPAREIVNDNARLFMPGSIGAGVSLRSKNTKWLVGLDYTYRDWSGATIDVPAQRRFEIKPEHVVRIGGEYIPNRYDIRYFLKRWSYRGGLFYENTYLQFDGKRVQNRGITFGVGIPVRMQNNAINIAAEIGQRGTTDNGLIRELYWKVAVSVSLYDLWFIKQRFE